MIIFAMVLIGFSELSQGQDTLKIRIGFFFVPQGTANLLNAWSTISSITPVFAVTSFNRGKSTVNVMYNITGQKAQVVYARQLSKAFGMYLLSYKNILTSDGYSGIGATRDVLDGKASAFVEFGSSWNNFTPLIFTGVIIPLVFRIK